MKMANQTEAPLPQDMMVDDIETIELDRALFSPELSHTPSSSTAWSATTPMPRPTVFPWVGGRAIFSHVEPGSMPVTREELYQNMLFQEHKYRVFNPGASYLQFRRIIVDWMTELGEEYGLSALTIHMSARHLDRLLGTMDVPKQRVQLVSLCCLLITTKFNEQEDMIPTIAELNSCTNDAYTADQIRQMEIMVLDALNWNTMVVTPLHVLHYLLHCDVICPHGTDMAMGRPCADKARRYMKKYCDFFADMSLQEYQFQKYTPSLLAASVVAASRRALKISPIWSSRCQTITGYSSAQIDGCLQHVWSTYVKNFPEQNNSPSSVRNVHQNVTVNA